MALALGDKRLSRGDNTLSAIPAMMRSFPSAERDLSRTTQGLSDTTSDFQQTGGVAKSQRLTTVSPAYEKDDGSIAMFKKAKGPATAPTVPSHGSIKPAKDMKMNNTDDNTSVEFSPEQIEEMKQAAALPWNQWKRNNDPRTWTPPTNDQWVKAINPHLVTVRLAFGSMFQSREETMAALEELEKGELFTPVMESIEDAIVFFTPILEVLQGTHARFFVAGSALCLRNMEVAQ